MADHKIQGKYYSDEEINSEGEIKIKKTKKTLRIVGGIVGGLGALSLIYTYIKNYEPGKKLTTLIGLITMIAAGSIMIGISFMKFSTIKAGTKVIAKAEEEKERKAAETSKEKEVETIIKESTKVVKLEEKQEDQKNEKEDDEEFETTQTVVDNAKFSKSLNESLKKNSVSKEKVAEKIDGLHLTNIAFTVFDKSICIIDKNAGNKSVLSIYEKRWKKIISGTMFANNTVKIEAVGKRPLHKSLLMTALESKDRSSNRIVEINGKKFGVLKECYGGRNTWWIHSLPYHHKINGWVTYYYDNTTLDVKILHGNRLNAIAKYGIGKYHLYIKDDKNVALCLALALAAIDSKDNRYTRFGK